MDVAVVPQAHLDWLAALPLLHFDAHRIFVHASVDPSAPLGRQKAEVLQWRRYRKEHDRPAHGRHVVHGHDAYADGPILLRHRSNLDVLGWRTGRLAVGVFDDDVPGGPVEIMAVARRP